MSEPGTEELTDALLETTTTLVGIALRALGAGPIATTVVQERILNLLALHGSLTIKEVAAELGVDQSNASRHCTRLEMMGAVVRTRGPQDLRSVRVALTAFGRDHVEASRLARRAQIRAIVRAMADGSSAGAVDVLARFNAAAAGVADREAVPRRSDARTSR